MRDKVAARRYARAITAYAESSEELERLVGELSEFASVFAGSLELRGAFLHPAIPDDRKQNILKEISRKMGLSEKCVRSLAVILSKGRIKIIEDIAESFSEMADEKLGRVRVNVASAFPLGENEIKKLEKTFSNLTGKEARVEAGHDGSLLGGIVARAGSMVYDGSISNQLRLMKVKLEQEE